MTDNRNIISQAPKSLWRDLLHAIKSILFLPFWHAQRLHKRNPNLWTFGAWSGERYSDNSRAFYEYVLANRPDIQCVWMTRSHVIYNRLQSEGKPVELCDSKKGKRIQKQAGYFFWTANIYDGDTRYMNGIHFINLWHGIPIKKIGEDAMGRLRKNNLFKRFKTQFRRICIPWEFLPKPTVCGSPFFAPFLKSAFQLNDNELILTPEPRLDFMFVQKQEELITNIKESFLNPTIVLYMPTFRDNKLTDFNPFFLAGFDEKSFNQVLVRNNIIFLYKGHFLDQTKTRDICNERIKVINDSDYENLYSLMKDVDILVTDYSSVYFDYIYLRKPIILFPFDYDEYVAESREFYFDYNLMEAIRVNTWRDLEYCLDNKTYHIPSDEEIQRFRPIPAGNSCERLCNIIIS